jgi:ankyrin repeat protein
MNIDYRVFLACREGDVEALQDVFPHGPTEWRDPTGRSLLHVAAQSPHLPVLDWLQTFPFDVNGSTPHGHTPLMWACACRQEAATRWLLARGAHVQATDLEGHTALHYACDYQWVQGVVLLLRQGANPEARDQKGRLPEDLLSVSSPYRATLCARLNDARPGCGLK